MSHEVLDAISLEMARRVARRLQSSPTLLDVARSNLARWTERNAGSPSLIRCYEEWSEILTRPLDEICDLLTAETDESQRLRQNSPFPGILSPEEVLSIKSEIRAKYRQLGS